jgi:hypothetical protein
LFEVNALYLQYSCNFTDYTEAAFDSEQGALLSVKLSFFILAKQKGIYFGSICNVYAPREQNRSP